MVVDGYRQIALGLVLTDDVLVEVVFYLTGLGHVFQLKLDSVGFLDRRETRFLYYLICLTCAVFTDKAADTRDEQFHISFATSAEITLFLHFFFSTSSIIP